MSYPEPLATHANEEVIKYSNIQIGSAFHGTFAPLGEAQGFGVLFILLQD